MVSKSLCAVAIDYHIIALLSFTTAQCQNEIVITIKIIIMINGFQNFPCHIIKVERRNVDFWISTKEEEERKTRQDTHQKTRMNK